MNEDEVARKIIARLDRDLVDLPASTLVKLKAARLAAVERAPATQSGPAGYVRGWLASRTVTTRLMLPAAIVLATLTGLIYWQMSGNHEEELDTGLLAGELPIHAYTDPGFETWLKHSNYAQSQR